jgi:translocator protein
MPAQNASRWFSLGLLLVLTFGVSILASQFQPGDWYAQLRKPAWNPPSWVFAPVWTLLYALMAVAAWLVWLTRGSVREAAVPLSAYIVQLALNGTWSFLFFGRQAIGAALVEIALLWLAILVTVVLFWRVRRLAGILLLPYFAWVSFAVALNAALWRLNI